MAAKANGQGGTSSTNPAYAAALMNLAGQQGVPQGLLAADPNAQAPTATTPQVAGLLSGDPTIPQGAAPPSLLAPQPATSPVAGAYDTLPAGPLPDPQTVAPPVYGDQAIARTGDPVPMSKTVGGVTTGPQVTPHPIAPAPQSAAPDSATPLAQTTAINQQALAAALSRLQAAQAAGYQPSSLFRRASPAGAYQ